MQVCAFRFPCSVYFILRKASTLRDFTFPAWLIRGWQGRRTPAACPAGQIAAEGQIRLGLRGIPGAVPGPEPPERRTALAIGGLVQNAVCTIRRNLCRGGFGTRPYEAEARPGGTSGTTTGRRGRRPVRRGLRTFGKPEKSRSPRTAGASVKGKCCKTQRLAERSGRQTSPAGDRIPAFSVRCFR